MYYYNKEYFKSLSIAFSKMLGSSTHALSEEIFLFIHYLGVLNNDLAKKGCRKYLTHP